jgi:hypothetical protein
MPDPLNQRYVEQIIMETELLPVYKIQAIQ